LVDYAITVSATPQIWLTLGLLAVALALYISERLSVEVVSIGMLSVMMLAFHLMPVKGANGQNLLTPDVLLAGFGNPALLTVMALLVVAEALSRLTAWPTPSAICACPAGRWCWCRLASSP
jgi:hypothetical protein